MRHSADLQLGGWSAREGNSACFGEVFGTLSAVAVGAGSQAVNGDSKEAARISILSWIVYLSATHRESETDRLYVPGGLTITHPAHVPDQDSRRWRNRTGRCACKCACRCACRCACACSRVGRRTTQSRVVFHQRLV